MKHRRRIARKTASGRRDQQAFFKLIPIDQKYLADNASTQVGRGDGGSVTAAFAMITSRTVSSPPFRNAAAHGTADANGNRTQVGRVAAHNKCGAGVQARSWDRTPVGKRTSR